MKKIIFFDTETTGNTDKDFLCQIAYKTGTDTFNGLYKPPIRIPPEASAVHHITNKMLEGKPSFSESVDYQNVKNVFEGKDAVAVAHNAQFDINMFKKENITPKNFICTLRLARYLDPEGKIAKYNLQYLRYLLEIEIEAQAHDALGDVLVLEQLFERLKKKIMENENLDEAQAIEKMIEVSSHPSLLRVINFGKHNGKEIAQIAKVDRGYLEWLLNQKLESDQIDEDWIYTLKYNLGML
jgi:DNA polymerase III epsilon subunit-like protein